MIKNQTYNNDEKYHFARFEKDTRYYLISLEKDLFEDWIITLINGRIQTRLGQTRTLAFLTYTQALSQFCIATKTRVKRGYHLQSLCSYDS
jgi:predicted DNA-binding WGR domain protein